MTKPNRNLTPERQATYYVGMGLIVVGGLLFLSTFVSQALHFGDFSNFESNTRSIMLRALGGIILIIIGGIVSNIGSRGLAGSGVVLDPEQARKDVEPWSRMTGGIANDALDEVEAIKQLPKTAISPAPAIKVRCAKCRTLNDEDARFCKQCAAPI